MKTEKSVIENSWNSFEANYAENYLHDADKTLPYELINYIFSNFKNPSIVDIGCGNARLYEYFSNFNKEYSYQGYDISTPLVDAANKKFGERLNFKCNLIDSSLTSLKDKKFDIAICSHVVELCDSPEKLFYYLSNISKTIAIIWYEYPRFEFSELEIRNYVSHDTAKKGIITPYLRNRYSKHYLNFLLSRFNLKSVLRRTISSDEKDVLEIYKNIK